jgi:hypothetical protein
MADAFFPFPDTPLVHWPRIKDPDFAAGVTSRRAAEHALGAICPTGQQVIRSHVEDQPAPWIAS